ncbi:hypothetical protein GCM10023149_37660 [Mucilaginibacter gynuensis]|uniref:Uncharacterized protein n=1 Tax=Mucilaginibacter gynuensis TaxID=1302236 RepID=A0ABP8GYA0_9SPHI
MGKVDDFKINIGKLEDRMIKELLQRHLISSTDVLYFKLTADELDVNGAIYAGDVARYFQAMFLPKPIKTLLYRYPVKR